MNIGIIGPTKPKWSKKLFGFVEGTAEILAEEGHSVVLTPDEGSTAEYFAKAFQKAGGKVIGVIPFKDREWGYEWLDLKACSQTIDCETWRNLPETLVGNSDILIAFGLSPGTMIELCYTKWFEVKKILYFKQFGSRLPKEIEKIIPIKYISSLKELEKEIKRLSFTEFEGEKKKCFQD